MKYDVLKKTEEFHFCFQNAVFSLLHCEQLFVFKENTVGK